MNALKAPNTAVLTAMNRPTPWYRTTWFRWVIGIVIAIVLIVLPNVMPTLGNQTAARMLMWAVAVLGLNVIMGYTGQVSLGQIFFVGVGAYATAITLKTEWAQSLGFLGAVIAFVLAIVVPGAMGFLIALAAARLKGLAIAMVTIALPIIGVPLAKRFSDLTGGYGGISVPSTWFKAPEWTGLGSDPYAEWPYYLVLVISAAVFALTFFLVRGKYGRAFAIVKANEAVAASMGISPYRTKVLAFTIASMIGGIGGFLYMVVVGYTSPDTMSFPQSINLVIATIVGGAGSIVGSLLGGVYFVLVTQIPTALQLSTYTTVIAGVVILLVLFLLPGGLSSLPRVIRRLASRGRVRSGGGNDSSTKNVDDGTAVSIAGEPGNTKK